MTPDKQSPRMLVWSGAIVIAAAVIGGLIFLRQSASRKVSDARIQEVQSDPDASERTRSTIRPVTASTSRPGRADDASTTTNSDAPNAPEQTTNTETPAQEARVSVSHLVDNFRNFDKPLTGYKLDNVERTVDGLALSKKDDTTSPGDGGVRRGTLESPVLTMAQPSNAVQPIWRIKGSTDSSVNVEIALSADQEKWSQWYPIEPSGDEISPTYPDGRPNPNYGAVSGSSVANGLDLYPYVRYRLTLTSTGKGSPVVQEFKLTHVDSTDGMGRIPDPPK
ncbi:MAG: hypothetical protein ACR2IE_12820 [Candidatus Sumerlaeaceae bacterium]